MYYAGINFSGMNWYFTAAVIILMTAGIALASRKVNKLFFVWRMFVLGLLAVLICQPAIVKCYDEKKPLLAIAVDVSPSVVLSKKIDLFIEFLENNEKMLRENFVLKLYGFASNSGEVKKMRSLEKAEYGDQTDIEKSIWEIRRESGEKLSGIVLLSDGNHNVGINSEYWIKDLKIPVFPVRVKTSKSRREVSINSLQVSNFAFKGIPVDVVVQINASGYEGKKLSFTLRDTASGSKIIDKNQVLINSENFSGDVKLNFIPGAIGKYSYVVEVSALKGELTLDNNRREFAIEVVHDKIRVLYLCGRPGPEYAFLRHSLKNDPLVELVSFVILRNPNNLTLVPENELSLIPFPVSEIFTKDIYDFDVMILENFTYRGLGFHPDYLQNIKKWVFERGGGLVVIGGENSYSAGGWSNTPVADILPVEIENNKEKKVMGLFRPVIENYDHYIIKIDGNRSNVEALWSKVPELDGCLVLRPKAGALVLARHPFSNSSVITAWQIGKGRVVALGSNDTWRWALGSLSPHIYSSFWKNTVRYAANAADEKKVSVVYDKSEYFIGQEFMIKMRLAEYSQNSTVKVVYFNPAGRKSSLNLFRSGNQEWVGSGKFDKSGVHKFVVESVINDMSDGSTIFYKNVLPLINNENILLIDNETLLNRVAEESNGLLLNSDEFVLEKLKSKIKKTNVKSIEKKIFSWDNLFILTILILLLTGEWYFRKRRGLV